MLTFREYLLTREIKDAMLNLGGDLRVNHNNIDLIREL